jgi:hypothetical protein
MLRRCRKECINELTFLNSILQLIKNRSYIDNNSYKTNFFIVFSLQNPLTSFTLEMGQGEPIKKQKL